MRQLVAPRTRVGYPAGDARRPDTSSRGGQAWRCGCPPAVLRTRCARTELSGSCRSTHRDGQGASFAGRGVADVPLPRLRSSYDAARRKVQRGAPAVSRANTLPRRRACSLLFPGTSRFPQNSWMRLKCLIFLSQSGIVFQVSYSNRPLKPLTPLIGLTQSFV